MTKKKLSGAEKLEVDAFTAKEKRRMKIQSKILTTLKQLETDIHELVTATKDEDNEFCKEMVKGVK